MTNEHAETAEAPQAASRQIAELLWAPAPTGSRGPKPALARHDVVRAGIEVADAEGLERLSMRAVADRLGVSTTGLYRYVDARNDLIALMADQVAAENNSATDHGGSWRERLEAFAYQEWDVYHRHPWLLDVPLRRIPPGPSTTAKYDTGLASALLTGLPVAEAVSVFQAVDHLVMGAAKASTENATLTKQSGLSVSDWWQEQGDVSLFEHIDQGRFPAIATVLSAGGFDQLAISDDQADGFAAAFKHALGLLLDGVESRVTEQEYTRQ